MSEFPMDDMDAINAEIGRLKAQRDDLLAALRDAAEFIKGSNECLDPSAHGGDREWIDYCVALQESCEEAIAKAEGRAE